MFGAGEMDLYRITVVSVACFIDRNVGEKRECCEYYRTIATQSSVFGAEGGQEETPCSVCKIEHPDSQPEKIHKYKKTNLQIQIYKYTRTKRDSMQEII